MDRSVQDARQIWNLVRGMWYLSAAVVFGAWIVLPILVDAHPRPAYPLSIRVVFLMIAVGDVLAGEWLKRLVRARLQSSGIKTSAELIAQIAGAWLFIAVLPFTPAILGGLVYIATGSRVWLTAFIAIGLVELALSKPNLEQYHDIVPGVSLD